MARKVGGFTVGKRMRFSAETRKSFQLAANRIRKAAAELDKTGVVGIKVIAEEIMVDVKASRPGHGVPRRDGHLAGSGKVSEVRHSTATGRSSVVLQFGDAAAPYALIQHETLHYHHKVGEARYLVRGLERWRPAGSTALAAIRANAAAGLRAASRGVRQ